MSLEIFLTSLFASFLGSMSGIIVTLYLNKRTKEWHKKHLKKLERSIHRKIEKHVNGA